MALASAIPRSAVPPRSTSLEVLERAYAAAKSGMLASPSRIVHPTRTSSEPFSTSVPAATHPTLRRDRSVASQIDAEAKVPMWMTSRTSVSTSVPSAPASTAIVTVARPVTSAPSALNVSDAPISLPSAILGVAAVAAADPESSRRSQVPRPESTTIDRPSARPRKAENVAQSPGSSSRAMRIATSDVARTENGWAARMTKLSEPTPPSRRV